MLSFTPFMPFTIGLPQGVLPSLKLPTVMVVSSLHPSLAVALKVYLPVDMWVTCPSGVTFTWVLSRMSFPSKSHAPSRAHVTLTPELERRRKDDCESQMLLLIVGLMSQWW